MSRYEEWSMIRVAINGFGRIGRAFLRGVMADMQASEKIVVVAINIGHGTIEHVAHRFKYDSIMGPYKGAVSIQGNILTIDELSVEIIASKKPADIDWKSRKIDWVIEASGYFTKKEDAYQHIQAGARHVLITAPAQGDDISIIPGVNEGAFDKNVHTVVSLGSCTTNAFIPLLHVLHERFGVLSGAMTTIHAYTNTQTVLDSDDTDLRRGRAAAINIVPTSTGAATMLERIMPDMVGMIQTMAIRVPVANVSCIDLTVFVKQEARVQSVHEAVMRAVHGRMVGIVGFSSEPNVSTDFIGSPYSVVVDSLLTRAQDRMVKVFGWYDNEWGYSQRLKDFLMLQV